MDSVYKKLPDSADHFEIARIARECVLKMHGKGDDYNVVAATISKNGIAVSREAIQTFANRDFVRRVNKNNKTLEAIYNFLIANRHSLDTEIQAYLTSNWLVFNGRKGQPESEEEKQLSHKARTLVALFTNWLNISRDETHRISTKMCGEYVLVRKSVHTDKMIVKSYLTIKMDDSKSMLSVFHTHYDRQGLTRTSEGFLISIVGKIYIIMNVEDSRAIELIALGEPLQFNFSKMMGFMITINIRGSLLCARVFIERNNEMWRLLKPRFIIDDEIIRNNQELTEILTSILDKDRCQMLPEAIFTDTIYLE